MEAATQKKQNQTLIQIWQKKKNLKKKVKQVSIHKPKHSIAISLSITQQNSKIKDKNSCTYSYKTPSGYCLAPNERKELNQSENRRCLDQTTSRNYRRRSINKSREKARDGGIVGEESSREGGEPDRRAVFLGYKLHIGRRLLIHWPLSPPRSCSKP